MSSSFTLPGGREFAYLRTVEFAVELLDAVTLERVSAGVKVVAEGLRGQPIVNASGLFVWLAEDRTALRKLVIDPQRLPYERRELEPSELRPRLTTILLEPRVDYPFPSGITALRGMLIEERVTPPAPFEPVLGAEMRLRWLEDDSATWHDSPIASRTDSRGDFATALRLGPKDSPRVKDGAVTVRLHVRRSGLADRESADLQLPRGRTAEPATFPGGLTFAWDDLRL